MLSRAALAAAVVLLPLATTRGQTVQLPTFNFFTVNTTVSVPDGGSALLGGVKRSSIGSVERGVPLLGKVPGADRLFRSRAFGREHSSAMSRVKARVIDLDELDEQVLSRAAETRAARGDYRTLPQLAADHQAHAAQRRLQLQQRAAAQQAEQKIRHYVQAERARIYRPTPARQPPPPEPAPTVQEVRQRNQQILQQRKRDAVVHFEKGRAAEAAGKLGAARVYYAMAERKADAQLKHKIAARLSKITKDR